ncbi:hypothetical protein [Methylobacterium sp. ID0610]
MTATRSVGLGTVAAIMAASVAAVWLIEGARQRRQGLQARPT